MMRAIVTACLLIMLALAALAWTFICIAQTAHDRSVLDKMRESGEL